MQPDVLSVIQARKERCSTCHQRHQFDPTVARRSEQCKTCHWGKDHRDWEAYDISIHGTVYQINKTDPNNFDFSKKLSDADYVGSCQYCHMRGGHPQCRGQRYTPVWV
ncbi:MAG: multiheme c-type cytochrome [Candidatus Scalinduaceae bacterium]